MTVYDRSVREAACGLFDRGAGYKSAARRLGVPPKAVRKWQQTYRAVGRDGLLAMGKTKRSYDHETKVAAARDWDDFEEFKRDLEAYIHHWNHVRRQVRLKGLTPVEFREQALRGAA